MRTFLSVPFLALALAAPAQQVRTVISNGPSEHRFDIVFLGDGYTAAQQAQFDADVLAACTAVVQHEPYWTYRLSFNVHSVFRASAQSGASNPPNIVNNAYGATFNFQGQGILFIANAALALADAALAPANDGCVMVLINDPSYGGGASGQIATAYNGTLMGEVVTHELGHALARLADEYFYTTNTYTGPEPAQANVTTDPMGGKWAPWLGSNGIGTFEGALNYAFGIWRPRQDCLMRNLNITYCAVCAEQTVRSINAAVNRIESPQPAGPHIVLSTGGQLVFSFTTAVVAPQISWILDQQVVGGATGTSLAVAASSLPYGRHELEVVVADPSTFVRNDPQETMVDRHLFEFTVSDPSMPDLHVSATAVPASASPGQAIAVTTTVTNDGPGASAPCTVDHFWSVDDVWDTSDLWLGGYPLAALAAAESQVTTRPAVVLPNAIAANPGTTFRILAVVDRGNQVAERIETNNTGSGGLQLSAPGCSMVLEYRDPLVYPRDTAVMQVLQGGVLRPTVIAPCQTAGASYQIHWTCSGTSPGTVVAPGIILPINVDACTSLGQQLTNGSILQSFAGDLDDQLMGQATIQWPPGFGAGFAMPTHFAAVLFDPISLQVFGVTNPIELVLQ